MKFFLNEGMNIKIEKVVETSLKTVCLFNYQFIARIFLNRRTEINACEIFDNALQAAAMKKHIMIMQFIINENVNVNQQSDFYDTVLQTAVYHDQHNVVKLLLDVGADVHVKRYSKDSFYAAAKGKRQDVITLMLRKGYKFQLESTRRMHLLHCYVSPKANRRNGVYQLKFLTDVRKTVLRS